jgi:glucose-6-phosphate 1-epimerase
MRLSTSPIAELNRRFGIPQLASVVDGDGALPKVQITAPAASGEMYLHGAHVTSWKPAGAQEALFLSPNSIWKDRVAIRGGVPVCFPWFGDKAGDPHAPAHGFVRTKEWQLDSIAQNGSGVSVSMFTESDAATRKWGPSDFRLLLRATFGAELVLELITTNTGQSPLRFEEAMHAYYNVGDVQQASISGLDSVSYLDKTDSYREKTQHGDVVITAETDRVYLNTQHTLELSDPALQRKIHVEKVNSRSTVIWNPWLEKSRGLADLGEGQWKHMLCIEVTNVGDAAIDLAPGQQHTMKATVTVS